MTAIEPEPDLNTPALGISKPDPTPFFSPDQAKMLYIMERDLHRIVDFLEKLKVPIWLLKIPK